MLARISHELRTPLNAIIGFAEVMIGERFGTLGNERYVEYMKDIRASGERGLSEGEYDTRDILVRIARLRAEPMSLAMTVTAAGMLLAGLVAVAVSVATGSPPGSSQRWPAKTASASVEGRASASISDTAVPVATEKPKSPVRNPPSALK